MSVTPRVGRLPNNQDIEHHAITDLGGGGSSQLLKRMEGLQLEAVEVRRIPAAAGAVRRDREGVGRHACPRHSDGARPLHPAGGAAGAASGLGRNVLGCELRLPAGALGAQGSRQGAGAHRVRPSDRRGHGPGEILRRGQSRRADGAGGQAGTASSRSLPSWRAISTDGAATSASARRRRCCGTSMGGSGGGSEPSSGSSGSVGGPALRSSHAVGSVRTWRHKVPAAPTAPGA